MATTPPSIRRAEADPGEIGRLISTLQTCKHEDVRNASLGRLLELTTGDPESQTSATFNGIVETIFWLLDLEDLTQGGEVAKDLLQCLSNIIRNALCQKYIRETTGFDLLVSAMDQALSGRRSGHQDNVEDRTLDQVDIAEDVRWICFGRLVDTALALAGTSHGQSTTCEASSNQGALIRDGAFGLCVHLLDPRISSLAKLRLAELFEALVENNLAGAALQSFDKGSPPIFFMVACLLGRTTELPLRCAFSRITGRALLCSAPLQSFLCSSLSPQLGEAAGEVQPPGRLIVGLCEEAASGEFDPERFWFAMTMATWMFWQNLDVQSFCVSLPVAVPTDAGPPETFFDLVLRVLSSCTRVLRQSQPSDAEELRLDTPTAAVVSILKLLVYWLGHCPDALMPFATSPVSVPLVVELAALGPDLGLHAQLHIEGLASLLMGLCVMADQTAMDVPALMSLVASHVGIAGFAQKVEQLQKSEALQRPPVGLSDVELYAGLFCELVQKQKSEVQQHMVRLYVSGAVHAGDGARELSDDVADHYRGLIRDSNANLLKVQQENQQLHKEVEAFKFRALKASSASEAERIESVDKDNEKLHGQVAQLTEDLETSSRLLGDHCRRNRETITEFELGLQKVAQGYADLEQRSHVEAQALALLRHNAATLSPVDVKRQREAAAAQRRAKDLEAELGDLQDLLDRIAASSPQAKAMIAAMTAAPVQ